MISNPFSKASYVSIDSYKNYDDDQHIQDDSQEIEKRNHLIEFNYINSDDKNNIIYKNDQPDFEKNRQTKPNEISNYLNFKDKNRININPNHNVN